MQLTVSVGLPLREAAVMSHPESLAPPEAWHGAGRIWLRKRAGFAGRKVVDRPERPRLCLDA